MPEFHHHLNLDLFFGSWPASRSHLIGYNGPLTDNSWDPRNTTYKFSNLNSTIVTWCTRCLISFNYGYMDESSSRISTYTLHNAHPPPTWEWGRWYWSQCPPINNEGTDFTNTAKKCVRMHCDLKLQCAQVVSVSYQSHEGSSRFKRMIKKVILNSSFFCAANCG